MALVGRPPGWLAGALLVLGALSALLGIAHAAVQNRLSRVIASSSIENTGLIVTGFGVALTGAATGDRRLVAAGLLAVTLQVVAHTAAKSLLFTSAAKSLLFTSAAGIETATGHDDLEDLRAQRAGKRRWAGHLVQRVRPGRGLADPGRAAFHGRFRVRVVSAGSPDEQFRVPGLGYRLVLALALTVGFAGVTLVRLVGLIVLYRPGRSVPPRSPLLTGRLPAPPRPPGERLPAPPPPSGGGRP